MTAGPPGGEPFERRLGAGRTARVDVVMPFYNHGVFVEEALDSVRHQTRAVNRVVVVDDGSTDGYSLDVLARLAGAPGVEVVRQLNQGPGAARNRGVSASTAEAVVLLDADDRMEPDHVAVALGALEGAPSSVGFAYPDQQSFGTLDDLTVMPAYNLFTLTQSNYCGTGCIVDRGVFDAGYAFAEDLLHGHEDWEFFLRIGAVGIGGVDFHGPALEWRRWGFSRSDGVNERTVDYQGELRTLHPEIFEPSGLVALKRRWSPALSVVVADVPATVAAQTCGDYEVASSAGGAPEVRGRWVVVLSEAAAGLLDDETFVERILRVLSDKAVLLSASSDGRGAVRWQRVGPGLHDTADGVVVDGATYHRWRLGVNGAPGGDGAVPPIAALVAEVSRGADRPHWRWTGPPPEPGERRRGVGAEPVCAPLPPPASAELPQTLDHLPERRSRAELRGAEALERERSFRWGTSPLFVPCSGPLRHASRTPRRWTPSPTVVLDLEVRASGEAVLRAVRADELNKRRVQNGEPRITLGRLWTRKFPGTLALYDIIDVHSHAHAYRVSGGPQAAGEARLGFASIEGMSGTVSLSDRLDWGVAALGARGIAVHRPDVVFEEADVYLEPAGDDTPGPRLRRGRMAPYLSGAGGMGATLYELSLIRGRVRYSNHPDDAVAHPELGLAGGVAVAELGPADPAVAGPVLEEVPATGGGVCYVTASFGPAVKASGRPVLGALGADAASGVALIRLRPRPSLPQPPGEVGYRLTVNWRPLGELGYEPEGSVGFVWPVDPLEAPLYQWRRPGSSDQLLTLGGRPAGGGWEFTGTLGLAWKPHVTGSGLVGLWELSGGDRLAYAVDPSEFTAVGFTCERVVAKIAVSSRPGSVPLWRTAFADDSPWRFTACPSDGEADGYVRQGVIGHLLAAHPPPEPADPRRADPLTGPLDLVTGPTPGALPVYLVSDGRTRWATMSLHGDLGRVSVEEVLGYLPSAAGPARD